MTPDLHAADKRLLKLLVRSGRLDTSAAAKLESLAAEERISIVDAAAATETISYVDIASAIAAELKIPLVDLSASPPSPEATERIDEKTARSLALVPVRLESGVLLVAMANPLDHEAVHRLEFSTGLGIRAAVAPLDQILETLQRIYRNESSFAALFPDGQPSERLEILHQPDVGSGPVDAGAVAREAAQPPIVKLVNLILREGFNRHASDIHIEPRPTTLVVRDRIDGILEEALQIPKWVHASMVARIKIMAKLDITERRRPQDGHFAVRFSDVVIDVRVSSMPTAYGEKIVLRLLNPTQQLHRLADIGLADADLATLRRLIDRPEGMLLVTGPTGSGKTTTLYAVIQEIVSPELNIVTIENPIEYELASVSQVPVNEKQGLTFAAVLRSVLRQDPDVIFVGEIRDRETAEIAFQAAQTGHLVLSTVHTNDTAATVTRLLELGIEPHVMGPSLLGIVAQRLVRRICQACAEPAVVPQGLRESLGLAPDVTARAGRGCTKCRSSGFAGRIGCYEILEVTSAIERLISERAPESTIRSKAEEEGMTSLIEDARRKIAAGITTPAEVARVVELDTKRRLSCPQCRATVEENFTVCPYCRTALRPKCSRCEATLQARWAACPFCGTVVPRRSDDPQSNPSGATAV